MAAPGAAAPAGDDVTETVVGVVSQLTGYPAELLDVDLDLEADLGVDTVKQAEIFAAIREHYGVARDGRRRRFLGERDGHGQPTLARAALARSMRRGKSMSQACGGVYGQWL